MSDQYSPEAGWYDDPERALMLRWWDGVRWTTHTRAKPVVEQPVAAAAWADMASEKAKTSGPFENPIPKTNLAKAKGL